jgi:hypothetical protein
LAGISIDSGHFAFRQPNDHFVNSEDVQKDILLGWCFGQLQSGLPTTAPGFTLNHAEGCPMDIETARLLLRDWRPEDIEPFARMNQDPSVIKFPRPQTHNLQVGVKADADFRRIS